MNNRNIQNPKSVPEISNVNLNNARLPISTPAPGGIPNYLGIGWNNLVKFISKRLFKFENGEPENNPSESQFRFDSESGILRGYDGKNWQIIARLTPEKNSITPNQLVIPSSMSGAVILAQTIPKDDFRWSENSIQINFEFDIPLDGIIIYSYDMVIFTQRVDSYELTDNALSLIHI